MTERLEISAVAISGSPARQSRSRELLLWASDRLNAEGVRVRLIDLAELPAAGLLAREAAPEVDAALSAVAAARIVLASTPVYRATYSGLLKVFFDLLPPSGLAGKIAIPIATGGGAAHQLALDHGLRPLFASVGALTVPTATYAIDAQFTGGGPDPVVLLRLERAVAEALALALADYPALIPAP